MEETLSDILKDPSRPVFLFGSTPPRDGTTEEKAKLTCSKFTDRSAVLATDGFIVYDIQDEEGRTEVERPFPFRKTMDAALYASYFKPLCAKECVVYKCVAEKSVEDFDLWVDTAVSKYGHTAFTLVGAPTSSREYRGPTLSEAGKRVSDRGDCDFGCVSIAERHSTKKNEDANMFRKQRFGAEWFITQGIFDAGPLSKLLNDYGDLCRKNNAIPKKVILTFAPCGRPKTMHFIKWLGMNVPPDVEKRILESEAPVKESMVILQELLLTILEQTATSGVPLGVNVESLSIYREEIDAAHELFQKLQASLLSNRGSPWTVKWFCVRRTLSLYSARASEDSLRQLEGDAASLHKKFSDERDQKVVSRMGLMSKTTVGTLVVASAILGFLAGKHAGRQ